MFEKKLDRRIIKSKALINDAFLQLILTVGFDKITVKAITEKANISRKTFYLHYMDKYDLLDQICTEHIYQLKKSCYEKPSANYNESAIIWFNYFHTHQSFFKALFKSENTGLFRKKLDDYLHEELSMEFVSDTFDVNHEIVILFLSSAILGIIDAFVLDKLNLNTEEVARQVAHLIESNLTLN